MLGDTTLPSVAGLDLQAVDEVDHVVEAAAGTRSDAASGDCDGHMCFAGAGTTDKDGVTLLGDEQIADNALRLVLAFDGGRHDLIVGGLHAIELEFAHEVEELSSFHQMV